MLVQIGRHPFEGARPVEYTRPQPEGVRASPDDRMIAFEPFAIEEGEGLRPGGHRFLILWMKRKRGKIRVGASLGHSNCFRDPGASAN